MGMCHYKISKTVPECNYEGYCDYQLPRDSRGKKIEIGIFRMTKEMLEDAITDYRLVDEWIKENEKAQMD